jgi:REase_DpnII-MboI
LAGFEVTTEAPGNEDDVHVRVEAVLRCVFPDLRRKPPVAKQIKNFHPDTGIPSIGTLIEYKFMRDDAEAKRITDEILADTRGYDSKEWKNFVYVIYETQRIRPESQWRQLLRESGVTTNTEVIVISGEQPTRAVEAKTAADLR